MPEEEVALMSVADKRREIKKSISRKSSADLKQYIKELSRYEYLDAYKEFIKCCGSGAR